MDDPQWFALKVSRKETLAISVMEKAGLRTYCPMAATDTTIQGKKVIVERPLIPNIVFVHAPFHQLNVLKNANPVITYCYKKVDEDVALKPGDKVKIVGGLFDGYEGTLLKAKGRAKRMFLINFEMLGALGTHIEPQYIRIIK